MSMRTKEGREHYFEEVGKMEENERKGPMDG